MNLPDELKLDASKTEVKETINKIIQFIAHQMDEDDVIVVNEPSPKPSAKNAAAEWSHNPEKGTFRHINPISGHTLYYTESSLPEEGRLALGIKSNTI